MLCAQHVPSARQQCSARGALVGASPQPAIVATPRGSRARQRRRAGTAGGRSAHAAGAGRRRARLLRLAARGRVRVLPPMRRSVVQRVLGCARLRAPPRAARRCLRAVMPDRVRVQRERRLPRADPLRGARAGAAPARCRFRISARRLSAAAGRDDRAGGRTWHSRPRHPRRDRRPRGARLRASARWSNRAPDALARRRARPDGVLSQLQRVDHSAELGER
jgi:hypothetical protein